jgi:dTDP-4-dehydrorhamnose reductase
MAGFRILVVGARGQLARGLERCGARDGHTIICRGRPDADLTDPLSLQRLFTEFIPDAVVNAAAYTAVEKAEEERSAAFAVNAEGAEHLARLCAERNLPLIHISTDYVFDGTQRTPYHEGDAIAPLGVYGASKAAGEGAIRRLCSRHVILRTAWLYSMEGQNFLTTMLRLGAAREELLVVSDQYGTPTWTHDVAGAILAVLRRVSTDGQDAPWGTYHLTADGTTTWFGFAAEIFRLAHAAGQKVPRLKAIGTADYPSAVRRPLYSVLDNSKIASAFDIRLPAWQLSLARCFAESQSAASNTKPASKEKVA